jgi:hypothetical protein
VFAHRGRDQLTWNELMTELYRPSAGEHPITPPPELVEQWVTEVWHEGTPARLSLSDMHITTEAARWGADQELEACCEWLYMNGYNHVISARLRDARRPEPPSLKEQALEQLRRVNAVLQFQATGGETSVIRRALEALDG